MLNPGVIRRAAVIGSPIEHSLSPVLHGAAYSALGLEWVYERHRVGGAGEPSVAEFVASLSDEWVGLSVTMPGKEAALAVADTVSTAADRTGAANTLIRDGAGWVAHNTDPDGVRGAVREAGLGQATRAVVLGAGATARSAVWALAQMGASSVTFVVRGEVRAETRSLAVGLGLGVESVLLSDTGAVVAALAAADAVVSTLPAGSPLGADAGFPEGEGAPDLTGVILLDAVYAGWPTPLARWAFSGGARVISGTEMLLHQAARQVELMTGAPAPVQAMRDAILTAVVGR